MVDRVLIVEDEKKILDHLMSALGDEGFSVVTCESLRELEIVLERPVRDFEVIVLDRLLHGKDSAQLMETVKKRIPAAKIMILSALNSSSEKATLLNLGADDYLAKPFDTQELIARVRALIRRTRTDLQLGNVILDLNSRVLKINKQMIALTNKEFILLKTLMNIPGKVYNKALLYEKAWEVHSTVESNAIEVTVNKLRKRLADAGANIQIKNARNLGYWVEE